MKKPIVFLFTAFLMIAALNAQTEPINTSTYLPIGNIEQWVTIKGNDRSKPIILFLHGGPGSVMSPYDAIYKDWEKYFVLVNWDQRGAGRTFGHNSPPEELSVDYLQANPLTVEQMTADGIELTEYLVATFGKQKIILMGTSWGSVLGVKMALKRPDLFYAYIGHSQIVNYNEGLISSYHKVQELAKKNNDENSIGILKAIGSPPYAAARDAGQLLRIVKKYERENSIPAPEAWWKLAPDYDNEIDSKHRYNGDDYSFINFMGHKKLGIPSMIATVDFMKDGLEFKIPVYFIQGEADISTPKKFTKPYFDAIKAPKKEYFLITGAAHGHNQFIVDKQYEIAKKCLVN